MFTHIVVAKIQNNVTSRFISLLEEEKIIYNRNYVY